MSDRLIWSSRMTQDYLKGLSDEEKHNALLDRGYDEEHLAGANLDDFIDRDEYMWEDDADDFYDKIAPMINRQTNGFVIAVNKDDPQADIIVCQPEDLVTEMMNTGAYSSVELYDVNGNVEAEYYDKNGHNALTVELYAVPNNEPDQVKFVQEIMPTFIQDAKDQMIDDEENDNPLDDYASYLMDYDILQDYVDKDRLKKFGQHIRPDLHEAVVNEGISFPKELEEAKSNGVGVQNADKFIRYLANNDRVDNGPFGEDSIVNNDGSVRLFSQASDITFTFTDDGGVVVEGEDEELGSLEEYFDSLDDFVKWCQAEALSLGSDVGCYDMERYLSGSGEEEVEEALTEEVVTEAKKVNTEALAEELEEIKEDFEDFGPDGFYAVPYESFKREFPEFAKNVIESFLTNYVEISPEEMNDPEVIDAWKSGDLITNNDWQTLFEGAEKIIAGNTPGWKDIYKKYYTEDLNKLEPEDANYYRKEIGSISDDAINLAHEASDEGVDAVADAALSAVDAIEDREEQINEASNMDKLKAHYGKKFGEELDHNPNGDEMK